MISLIIPLIFLTTFLLFLSILQFLTPVKEETVKSRIDRYFSANKEDVVEEKKIRLKLNLNRTKINIRKKLLTKAKNNKLEISLYRAGVPLKPEEYVMFQWIAVALGAGILYLFVESIIIMPIGGIVGFLIPRFILKKKESDKAKAFNDDLPEMISSVVGALKSGFSFPQALTSVMEEAKTPMKEELGTVLREMQYGTAMEEALNNLKERMPSDDLDLMIQAIIIQRQVGGNLATVLEKIVQTIRDRIKIQGQIATLTAQGRLSGMVIGLLPVILGLVLYLIQPDYIGVLFSHPIGLILVAIAIVSCTIGFFLIRKLTTIEV
ncbi:type II secretion system F family protein [Virgibacillus sp. DJP39]|uniref:type II secretion system F family protein n=1 Tax=Virgibacillus sp. DJP39 TaxID=3409790 RepID=UPI003BB774DB